MLHPQPPQVAGPLHNDLHRRPASSRSESKRWILTGESVPRNEAAGNHSFFRSMNKLFYWRWYLEITHKNYMIFIGAILSCKGRESFQNSRPPLSPRSTHGPGVCHLSSQAPEKNISHGSSSCQPFETGGKMWGSSCWYHWDKRAACQNAASSSGRVLKMVRTLISAVYYLTSPDSHR